MEIQSAFNSGVQGFQRATETANQAAADIVANTSVANTSVANTTVAETTVAQEADAVSQAPVSKDNSNERKIPELNQSIVDLKVAEYQAKASAEVIKTADDSLGTLLDVTA